MLSLLLRVSAPLVAVLVCSATALGQDVLDQDNDPEPVAGFSCGTPPFGNAAIAQSFVPEEPSLVAVALRLRAGDLYPAEGTTATVRVRVNDPAGEILVEASADVPPGLAEGEYVLVRFDFDEVALTPGDLYVIEWLTPPSRELSWGGRNDDPYPAGNAFSCVGRPWPNADTDFNFQTFAPAPAEEPTCKERLEELLEYVGRLDLDRCTRQRLERPLRHACRMLDRGHDRVAHVMVRLFRWHVVLSAHFGRLGYQDAKDLLEMSAPCLRGNCYLARRTQHRFR